MTSSRCGKTSVQHVPIDLLPDNKKNVKDQLALGNELKACRHKKTPTERVVTSSPVIIGIAGSIGDLHDFIDKID